MSWFGWEGLERLLSKRYPSVGRLTALQESAPDREEDGEERETTLAEVRGGNRMMLKCQ